MKNNSFEKPQIQKTEVSNLNAIAEKFGDSLLVLNQDNSLLRAYIKDLGRLPESFIFKMKSRGLKIVMGEGTFISVLERAKGLQYRILELISKVSEKKNLDAGVAAYNEHTKTIFISTQPPPLPTNVPLHEYGHAVGDLFGLNKQAPMSELHKELFPKLNEYIQMEIPGGISGTKELIADSFADFFILHKEGFVNKYNSRLYNIWTKIIEWQVKDTN